MIKFLLDEIGFRRIHSIILGNSCLNYTAKIVDWNYSSFDSDEWFITFEYDGCKNRFYNNDIIDYTFEEKTCYIQCILE